MDHAARIEETIQGIYHSFEHPGQHPADSGLMAIDNWIQALDGLGGSALAGLQGELRNLRGYVQSDDRPAMANSLQHLGQETSRIARDMHDGVGDHLRHLGQVLITAAGNLKMS
jgi:signal transduction histidine kinase